MKQRTNTASHWIRVDESSAASKVDIDRGWRLHVSMEDDEGFVVFSEEQVFPERVMRADANHIRAENGHVKLDLADARWLRERLDEIIPELERRLA